MQIRKLLLISLFTGFSLVSLMAQLVNVHGTVTNASGDPAEDVSVFVTAFFADSTGVFETLQTNAEGMYEVDINAPANMWGIVEVSIVDCSGFVISQVAEIGNGIDEVVLDFVYCSFNPTDSCFVYIIEEWIPGVNTALTAIGLIDSSAQFLWSTGESGQTIYPQGSGNYCVTVSYATGCVATDCYDFIIDSTGFCFAYITTTTNSDGTYNLEVIPSGGTAPFIFAWNTSDSTAFLNGVGPGTYCATVIDAEGCTYTACVFLDNPFCEVWIYEDFYTGSLIAEGYGEPPFSYVWNTGDTSQEIFPNSPGTYCVTVSDANQCTASSCYYYYNYDTCYVYVNPVFFGEDTIALQAIGSPSGNFTYLWNTGETTDIIFPDDPSLDYCVTITDTDGCVASGCFESAHWCYAWVDVQYVDTTTAVLNAYTDPIFGWGGSNNASYLWSNGATTPSITVSENGNYCVTVTIGNNCVAEACGYVDFDSLGVSCSAWVVQYSDPSTNQWYAEVLAWGFGTFTYLWTTGDTTPIIELDSADQYVCVTATSSFGCETTSCVDTFYTECKVYIDVFYLNDSLAVLTAYSWNDPNQGGEYIWSDGQTGQSINVWVSGSEYCVTVTGGGCIAEACVYVDSIYNSACGVWISEEPAQSGIQFTANAWGTPPFTYLWSNGSTDMVQIIDFGLTDLCVTVTDATGCYAVACNYDSIVPDYGNNFITGYVYGDSLNYFTGKVYAYSISSNGGPFILVDSTDILHGGLYKLDSLANGLYVIKAEAALLNNDNAQFLPTYHLNSATWETASPHALPNWLPVTTDIFMIPIDSSNGSGVIGGIISDPNHIVAGQGDEVRGESGIAGIHVLLKDVYGTVINYKVSLQDGSFRFTGLPLGTYRIVYDIPGVSSPEIWVTLTQDDSEKLNVTLVVTGETVAVDDLVTEEVSIYPNPATEEITIQVPEVHSSYDVRVVDMQGRVVYAGNVKSLAGIMHIEVGQYSPGLYHINLMGDDKSYFGRFVKQE